MYLCLFAGQGYDLRALVRGGANDEALRDAVAGIWQGRADRYSELRASLPTEAGDASAQPRRIEMSYIGG